MRVRMKGQISGVRDDVPWPPKGGVVDLPDGEAAELCAQGMAEPVVEEPKPERAVAAPAEKRAARGKQGR